MPTYKEFTECRNKGLSFKKTMKKLYPNRKFNSLTNKPYLQAMRWICFFQKEFKRPLDIKDLYFKLPTDDNN